LIERSREQHFTQSAVPDGQAALQVHAMGHADVQRLRHKPCDLLQTTLSLNKLALDSAGVEPPSPLRGKQSPPVIDLCFESTATRTYLYRNTIIWIHFHRLTRWQVTRHDT
jgi:hypothetical protein